MPSLCVWKVAKHGSTQLWNLVRSAFVFHLPPFKYLETEIKFCPSGNHLLEWMNEWMGFYFWKRKSETAARKFTLNWQSPQRTNEEQTVIHSYNALIAFPCQSFSMIMICFKSFKTSSLYLCTILWLDGGWGWHICQASGPKRGNFWQHSASDGFAIFFFGSFNNRIRLDVSRINQSHQQWSQLLSYSSVTFMQIAWVLSNFGCSGLNHPRNTWILEMLRT